MTELQDTARYQRVTREPPEILFQNDPEWNKICHQAVAHIPSGYTYLAQLLGHDMGHSMHAHLVPHVPRGDIVATRGARIARAVKRVNLIAHPLTLETVYGAGPRLMGHVFDPVTLFFRLDRSANIARILRPEQIEDSAVRALYDERNRDTLMLHELTTVWMQFHNLCARSLIKLGMIPTDAYYATRTHVLQVWHDIIRNDILPRFVHPDIAALDEATLPRVWKLDEITLQHGLFRAFHSMPLEAYHLPQSGDHPISHLLKNTEETGNPYDLSMAEREGWFVDWARFFGKGDHPPMTGISVSMAALAAVAHKDFATAKEANPLRMNDNAIRHAIAALPDGLADKSTPAQLAHDFAQTYPSAPYQPDEIGLTNGPLYLALMIEAQLHGKAGGFGPLGSALFRASILEAIARVAMPKPWPNAADLPTFPTMLDLIDHVRKDRR